MASQNTDFLRFSAYSIKDLIIRKLSEDTKFTDQIYEGSNINTLIDLVAYMYQCLTYLLNNAASESMFSDTQIYENINRLVKMIGYNPRGITPSQAMFYIDNKIKSGTGTGHGGRFAGMVIPAYSYFDSGKKDRYGKSIYFSTKTQHTIDSDADTYQFIMYNGKWKRLDKIFTASGTEYETFDLGIGSSVLNRKFVGNNLIDVYVRNSITGKIKKWSYADNLFINLNPTTFTGTNDYESNGNFISQYGIYSSENTVYTLRLDERKNYELKFGNGKIGKKLEKGDQIIVFYLETNGLDGKLNVSDVGTDKFLKHSKDDFSISESMYNEIFSISDQSKVFTNLSEDQSTNVFLQNATSQPIKEDGVTEIKTNAPDYYKMGSRLVTNQDYEFYIKSQGNVIDCKCMNNWEYISRFFKWLYFLGDMKHKDPLYYIKEQKLVQYNYKFADPSDSNNIFLWTKLDAGEVADNSDMWREQINNIKINTTEVSFIEPIVVNFCVCAAENEVAQKYFDSDDFDENDETYIEILIDNSPSYVNSVIEQSIAKVFQNFFNKQNMSLGQTVELNTLLNQIYSINGVSRVRTIWQNSKDETDVIIRSGLSFASWSSTMIEPQDDFDISNTTKKLEEFQFPNLYKLPKIKVIKKSLNNINTIQY